MTRYANGPRFPMRRPVITPGAQDALDKAGISGSCCSPAIFTVIGVICR